jgi:hypothetical protein
MWASARSRQQPVFVLDGRVYDGKDYQGGTQEWEAQWVRHENEPR